MSCRTSSGFVVDCSSPFAVMESDASIDPFGSGTGGLGSVNSNISNNGGLKFHMGDDATMFKSASTYDNHGNKIADGTFAGSDAFTYGKMGLGAINDVYNGVMAYKNYKLQKKQVDANIQLGQENYGLALAKANNDLQDRKNAHDRSVAAGISSDSTAVDDKYKKDSGYSATTYGA